MISGTGHRKLQFGAGDVIIRQGDHGSCAYVIEEGTVEIIVENSEGEKRSVATRGVGSIIGEMAIVDDMTRVASVRAISDCTMLEVSREDFSRSLKASDPVIQMITKVILTRYRDLLSRTRIMSDSKDFPPPEELEKSLTYGNQAVEKIKIANEFAEALVSEQLTLNYQPIINIKGNYVAGFESLMRWNHPEKGAISPALFIPVIEELDLMLQASGWVFQRACESIKRIRRDANCVNSLYVGVNFSSKDLGSDDFVQSVYNTLSITDVSAKNTCIEITERILIDQPDRAKESLEMCRNAGMNIAIDDFGTGYSSLNYLHHYPINVLKIDRSFIVEMCKKESSKRLVKSMIDLGKNMDMTIIAEGVEQEQEVNMLREMGCDCIQGFYFSKPLPEKDLIDFINTPLKIS